MSKHSAYLWLPLLLWSAACGAHPHSWIDMVSQLQINRDGQLTELRLAWLFDEFYSASILDDAKPMATALSRSWPSSPRRPSPIWRPRITSTA